MRKYILLLLLAHTFYLVAQKHDNVWVLGYGCELTDTVECNMYLSFDNQQPTSQNFHAPIWMHHTNSSISNKDGKLQFYTNGQNIYNKNNQLMQNETGFNPADWTSHNWGHGLTITQAVQTLPCPNDTNLYYIFHSSGMWTNPDYCPDKFYYTLVDMRQDGGRGAVIDKNHLLIDHLLPLGNVNACKHANGVDWWIMIPEYGTNCFYRFLLTSNGIQTFPQQCEGPIHPDPRSSISLFSPDGKTYVKLGTMTGNMYFYHFDRCKGEFSYFLGEHLSSVLGLLAFSPNSHFLYRCNDSEIYQYDMQATDIIASQQIVAIWDGFQSPNGGPSSFCTPLLALDNKIYITTWNGSDYYGYINKPDSLGIACDVRQHQLHLSNIASVMPPNFPHFRLGADTSSCMGVGISPIKKLDEIKIYPNPVSDKIIFDFGEMQEARNITIYNAMGELIITISIKQTEKVEYNAKGLPQGVYYYAMEKGIIGKFVVIQ